MKIVRLLLIGLGALLAAGFASSAHAQEASPVLPTLPGADALPAVDELPDPFLFADGTRVKTVEDWRRRREELKALILGYEYGRMPPPVKVEVNLEVRGTPIAKNADPGRSEQEVVLRMGPGGVIGTHLFITAPPGKGPFPVIVKGDYHPGAVDHWTRVAPEIVAEMTKRGYMLIEFDRTDFAPDKKEGVEGVRALYPGYDWGLISAWAWGIQRVIDYTITRPDVDAKRIILTGHSRGGKAALLAGALDERIAVVVANGSGCGGAGCYRLQPPLTEDIAKITKSFPTWFSPQFNQFIGHVNKLPFDQHSLKALVAPRPLLCTEATGDVWANAPGTQATHLAAREVYQFLGVPDKIGITYRPGKHAQNADDFAALLDLADQQLNGKTVERKFDQISPDTPRPFAWTAPK
jgi:hypothetical protein